MKQECLRESGASQLLLQSWEQPWWGNTKASTSIQNKHLSQVDTVTGDAVHFTSHLQTGLVSSAARFILGKQSCSQSLEGSNLHEPRSTPESLNSPNDVSFNRHRASRTVKFVLRQNIKCSQSYPFIMCECVVLLKSTAGGRGGGGRAFVFLYLLWKCTGVKSSHEKLCLLFFLLVAQDTCHCLAPHAICASVNCHQAELELCSGTRS